MVALLFLPSIVHLVIDSIKMLLKHKAINHLQSGIITTIVGVPSYVIFTLTKAEHWTQPIIAMLCFHFAFFSISLNIVRMVLRNLPHKFSSIYYLGTGALTDRILSPVPPHGRLFLWALIALVGFVVTYMWQCIIYGDLKCPGLYGY
jgi:hypothetical protein